MKKSILDGYKKRFEELQSKSSMQTEYRSLSELKEMLEQKQKEMEAENADLSGVAGQLQEIIANAQNLGIKSRSSESSIQGNDELLEQVRSKMKNVDGIRAEIESLQERISIEEQKEKLKEEMKAAKTEIFAEMNEKEEARKEAEKSKDQKEKALLEAKNNRNIQLGRVKDSKIIINGGKFQETSHTYTGAKKDLEECQARADAIKAQMDKLGSEIKAYNSAIRSSNSKKSKLQAQMDELDNMLDGLLIKDVVDKLLATTVVDTKLTPEGIAANVLRDKTPEVEQDWVNMTTQIDDIMKEFGIDDRTIFRRLINGSEKNKEMFLKYLYPEKENEEQQEPKASETPDMQPKTEEPVTPTTQQNEQLFEASAEPATQQETQFFEDPVEPAAPQEEKLPPDLSAGINQIVSAGIEENKAKIEEEQRKQNTEGTRTKSLFEQFKDGIKNFFSSIKNRWTQMRLPAGQNIRQPAVPIEQEEKPVNNQRKQLCDDLKVEIKPTPQQLGEQGKASKDTPKKYASKDCPAEQLARISGFIKERLKDENTMVENIMRSVREYITQEQEEQILEEFSYGTIKDAVGTRYFETVRSKLLELIGKGVPEKIVDKTKEKLITEEFKNNEESTSVLEQGFQAFKEFEAEQKANKQKETDDMTK